MGSDAGRTVGATSVESDRARHPSSRSARGSAAAGRRRARRCSSPPDTLPGATCPRPSSPATNGDGSEDPVVAPPPVLLRVRPTRRAPSAFCAGAGVAGAGRDHPARPDAVGGGRRCDRARAGDPDAPLPGGARVPTGRGHPPEPAADESAVSPEANRPSGPFVTPDPASPGPARSATSTKRSKVPLIDRRGGGGAAPVGRGSRRVRGGGDEAERRPPSRWRRTHRRRRRRPTPPTTSRAGPPSRDRQVSGTAVGPSMWAGT